MPRVKVTPNRRSSNRRESDAVDLEESTLDDEEINRLEQELNSIRREKAKQIRKMRYKREERTQNYDTSCCSSDEEDYMDDEQEVVTEGPRVEARQSTRDLADGFDKAQKRFMFNVRHIEEKYRERERRGLPETKIEMDFYGRFYFPESMAGCHQQAFVNRLYQNDTMFGKGSVSAPRNSIQSFDGDQRALTKSLQLDKQFGRKLHPTENHHYQNDGRKGRIVSSAQVSGIPKFVPYSSVASSSRYDEFSLDDYDNDDDDVFEERPRERQLQKDRPIRISDSKTRSKMDPELTEEDSEEKEEDSVDDEETTGDDSSNESLCDEDEDEEEEEEADDLEEKKDDTRGTFMQKMIKEKENRIGSIKAAIPQEVQMEYVGIEQSYGSKCPTPTAVVTEKSVTVKSEILLNDEHQKQPVAPVLCESKNKLLVNAKIESKESKDRSPSTSLRNKSNPSTPSRSILAVKADPVTSGTVLNSVSNEEKEDARATRLSTQNQKKQTKDIRTFFKAVPLEDSNTKNTENAASSESVPPKPKVRRSEPSTDVDDIIVLPTAALSERPTRIRKPTAKVAVEKSTIPTCHRHTACDKNNETKSKKPKRDSSPYCKHCVLLEEEKKQVKLEAKLNNSLPAKVDASETSETSSLSSKVQEQKRKSANNKSLKKPDSVASSSSERSAHSKRRSENLAAEGPEKKKQRLTDSDFLSIPSSMAIVVDTELISSQNPTLSSSNVPMFSDKRPTPSAWNSNIDKQWLQDFKKIQSKAKNSQFFGVQVNDYPKDVPLINIWVDNIRRDASDKDPFETDVRRLLAQDKKARLDVKAGYDVR